MMWILGQQQNCSVSGVSGLSPKAWTGYRVASESKDSRRQLEVIAIEELANLVVFVLSEHGSTSITYLARTICRL